MISRDEYQFLQAFLREQMGYELADGREDLVSNRLGPVAASLGLEHVGELLGRLRAAQGGTLRDTIIDVMSNNETYFFRAPRVFESLRTVVIPALKSARAASRSLRIWSAACATGQEPYSIAMLLAEHFSELDDWSVGILATDVSDRALERARVGLYTQFEVQRGLPVTSLLKHFQKVEDRWQISSQARRSIRFRKHNLLDPFSELGGPFDIILARNVLIYFDVAAKSKLLARLRQVIAPNGYLILGESETILGLTDQFSIPSPGADYYVPAGGPCRSE